MIWNLAQITGLSIEDVLYKWSYENVLLFSRATPSYDTEDDNEKEGKKWNPRLDANNPDNFSIKPNSENEDEEYVV